VTGTPDNPPVLGVGDRFADEAFALAALPKRTFGAHKWGVGGLVLIAGGPGYIGAAALAAMSAARSGAGIVNIAISRGSIGPVATLVPEAVFIPLGEGDLEASARRARESIEKKLDRCKALVIGPGLGDDDYVNALLVALFGKSAARRTSELGFHKHEESKPAASSDSGTSTLIGGDKPAVIDADGLNWLAKQTDWWTTVKPFSLVLTPHIGEMSRLTGETTEEILADPAKSAKTAATKWQQVVVLKYGHTIATDGSTAILAEDALSSLATAGSGDVFAGSLGAFLAQGVAALDAAGLAMYVGGQATKTVEHRFGVLGLVASDLPQAIAESIAEIERKRDGSRG